MGPGDGRKVAPHLEISDLNLHSLVLLKALDGAGGGGGCLLYTSDAADDWLVV